MNIVSIFVTGLFAGGLTCLAVQGGLLATCIANQSEDSTETATGTHNIISILSFLFTRLIAYTILGFLLGSLGTVAQLSLGVRVGLQFVVAIFMIGTALNLLQFHPVFRYFAIQPPRFLTRMVRNQSRSAHLFAPALLGLCTVFIPCGATQAMMAYAITTGSSLTGALVMSAFILGTSPLFLLFGVVARKAGMVFSRSFNTIAAVAIICIALYNLNGAIALSGSNMTADTIFSRVYCSITSCQKIQNNSTIVDTATINFTRSGYASEPQIINVKAGSKVTLKLVNKDAYSCIQAFTIPSLSIQKIVQAGTSGEIEFTAPQKTGVLPFMCSMGMYKGSINVL